MQKVSSLEQQNAELFLENAELKNQIEWFRKHVFGTGKSEKWGALQLSLKLAEEQSQQEDDKGQTQQISYERKKPVQRESKAEHFKNFPVAETQEILPDEVKADPDAYERIGEEETFEVDITPPKLFKRRIVRPKFRRVFNRDLPPVMAPAPKRAVNGGYASAGLLAWITLSKYVDHLPLYRQEKMSQRWGATISRKTMSDWIETVSHWFEPVYGLMRKQLLESGYVQVDETPVKFLDPDQKKGKSTQGYLWVVGKPGGNVVFDWRLSRRHDEATSLLDGFEGVLQSDGYAAYENFANERKCVMRVACFAHVRRKFVEAIKEDPPAVNLVLRLIGHLYKWERQWNEKKLNGFDQRIALRTSHSAHPLSLLKKVVLVLSQRSRPKSNLGKACTYILGQWSALVSHCLCGQTNIDNNLIVPSEQRHLPNAIRPSAVGKKNFLFIGSPQAGKKTAIIYSIVVSCQRYGIDPLIYMKDLLERLPAMSNQDDLTQLLPNKWKVATEN